MTSIRLLLATTLAVCSTGLSAQHYQGPAVPPFCGDTSNNAPTAKLDWNYSGHFTKLTRVGNIYMPNFGSGSNMGDSMTQPYWVDSSLTNGDVFGAAGWNETWYLPADADGSNRRTMYRLYSSAYGDHMDSEDGAEGSTLGYSAELVPGYPFTASVEGTSPLTRYFSSNGFDHRTERPGLSLSATNGNGQTLSYGEEFRWNNTTGRPTMYGYPRYGRLYKLSTTASATNGRCAALTYGYVNQLDNNRVRVDFNREWGNAIGRIVFDGRQLVDDINIGALVQSVLWVVGPSSDARYQLNPTEAGGWDEDNPSNAFRWAGSPILSAQTIGTFNPSVPAPIGLKTRLKPLNYYHSVYKDTANGKDTSPTQPLMWRGVFERETTLGYQYKTGTAGYLNNVIKVGFKANVDSSVPSKSIYASTNMMTSYFLRLHNFGTDGSTTQVPHNAASKLRLMAYRMDNATESNLATSAIMNVSPAGDFQGGYTIDGSSYPRSAIIAYTDGGGFAIGFVSQLAAIGDPYVAYSIFLTGKAAPAHDDEYVGQNIAVLPYRFRDLSGGAVDHHDTFMVMGTLAEVKTTLQRIHCKENGGTCS
jgi:hypothetical protein